MKVISIGNDRNLFKNTSSVAKRSILYGEKMKNLFIVVFSLKKNRLENFELSRNVSIYPTNSLSKIFFIFDAFLVVRNILKLNKFSKDFVITCQDPFFSGIVGLFVSKLYNIPLHIQIHTDFLSESFYKNSILDKISFLLAKVAIPRASSIRVVSERIKNNLIKSKIKFKEIYVLPISFDKDNFLKNVNKIIFEKRYDFENKLIMVSRLEKEKNIEEAIFAFKRVLEQYSNTGMFIVGDGSMLNYLKKLTNDLGINEKVIFLGFREDIASLLSSCDIFILTSIYEGYGLSVIEAGLSKCPVIISNVGVSGEIIKDDINGFIYNTGNVNELSDRIIRLISNENMRHEMAEKLYEDLQKKLLSEKDYVDKYVFELEKLL